MTAIEIGRLLRASTAGFVVGCRASQLNQPSFGALVGVSLENDCQIYGLIHDIHIDDDGLVRQLVTAETVDENIIADNRLNRNTPLEISVLVVGYDQNGRIYHLLPPRPPLSLDSIHLCDPGELRRFSSAGRFGYFRHILRAEDLPVGELLATHLKQAHEAHSARGDGRWIQAATQELIILLRDDYPTLMSVLSALGDAIPGENG
ncbi:MAG: hypothetical protein JXB15_15855 [Anaerolineales bacterium]|nr:hypothetical protein [Anaerolineales bacterium]